MNNLCKFWKNFKLQPDVWFFYGFLITFTLSVRKVLFFYPVSGQFNEWTGLYLYLSDIFLVLTLISWLIVILQNKSFILSIDTLKLWLKKAIIYLPLILVLWSFTSILWSENQNIALFKAIKLLELFLLYVYVIHRIIPSRKNQDCSTWNNLDSRDKRETFLRRISQIIITLGFIQAIIGIGQFILQHSIGLFWLKESLILPNIPGVAKIVFNGEKLIRAYGLFPHPNILGGFMVLSIILTLFYRKAFCPINDALRQKECSTWNILRNKRGTLLLKVLLFTQILALLLTFSKSAILGLIIAIIYITFKIKDVKALILKKYLRMTLIGIIIIILLLFILKPSFNSILAKSINDRITFLNVSRGTIANNSILGVGMGQSVLNMPKYSQEILENWQYQPVHNVFLLIWSELGIIGLAVFVYFIIKLFKNAESNKLQDVYYFKAVLISFIFIMLFDHYFWDIQQGQIMLWLIFGFLACLKDKILCLTN